MDYKIPFTSSSSLRASPTPLTTPTASSTTLSASSPAPELAPTAAASRKSPPFAVSTEIKSSAAMSHDHDPSQDCDDGCNGKAQFSPPPGSDQMSQQSGGSKRKRVSLACNACRTRKSKVSCSYAFSVGSFSVEEELSACWRSLLTEVCLPQCDGVRPKCSMCRGS